MKKLLEIKNLNTIAEDDSNKHILKGLNLVIHSGEVHVIMGPNGSGKSTLANTIFHSPRYIVTDGNIVFEDCDITNETTDKIAKKGIFMSFQTPEEIPGVPITIEWKKAKKPIKYCGKSATFSIIFFEHPEHHNLPDRPYVHPPEPDGGLPYHRPHRFAVQ